MQKNPRIKLALDELEKALKTGESTSKKTQFSRLFDVGCDHAQLCIGAAKRGLAKEIFAMDIGSGPLEKARENILYHHQAEHIQLLLSDGLDEVQVEPGDCVTILGMGGLEIADIVERVLWPEDVMLMLQPMRSLPELRMRMASVGLTIEEEYLLKHRHKLYVMFRAAKGHIDLSFEEAFIGQYWLKHWKEEPLFSQYHAQLRRTVSLKQRDQDQKHNYDLVQQLLDQMEA